MGISVQEQVYEDCLDRKENYSEFEGYDSDDSQDDPTFDVLEESRSSFSKLYIGKKSKSRNLKEMEDDSEPDSNAAEMVVPEFVDEAQKYFETVQKIIEAGQIEKLKVDQCKVYLRKHGLRLTGTKDTLIGRIKEHIDILNGGGEKKYPVSSFVFNCKGDACMGDVVMFEQNVYEMFNIASRSASGPPCGTRIVAGRIVKESYGAAKQQHTFTIEVLWSKGEKPLPPLHPLLIKGRNLYRLNTMRQKWQDEEERQKILLEKHTRGSFARLNREARVREKELVKVLKGNRLSRVADLKSKQEENKILAFQSLPISFRKLASAPHLQQKNIVIASEDKNEQQSQGYQLKNHKENTSIPVEILHRKPTLFPTDVPSACIYLRQPVTSMSCSNPSRNLFQSHNNKRINDLNSSHSLFRQPLINLKCRRGTFQTHDHEQTNMPVLVRPYQGHELKQVCRFYAQGRCWHGQQCKYLHEYRETR